MTSYWKDGKRWISPIAQRCTVCGSKLWSCQPQEKGLKYSSRPSQIRCPSCPIKAQDRVNKPAYSQTEAGILIHG